MSFARWPLSSVSPLYTLTVEQSENTPGAKTCHRKSCTTEPMITATQSEGYKIKRRSAAIGIRVSEEQEPTQTYSRVIWNMFGDCLGDTIQKVTYISLIQNDMYVCILCANVRTDEAGRQGQRKSKSER